MSVTNMTAMQADTTIHLNPYLYEPKLKLNTMKKSIYWLLSAAIATSLASCSSNKQPVPAETTEPAGSDMMKEEPAYDATKIDPAAPVAEITLKAVGNTMADMGYDQKELRVKAGSTVHLQLINTGTDPSMLHNFVLIEEGTADKVGPEGMKAGTDKDYVPAMRQVLVATHMTPPGGKSEITFPAPAKGSYDFICTYPGHYQKMNGKFIVL